MLWATRFAGRPLVASALAALVALTAGCGTQGSEATPVTTLPQMPSGCLVVPAKMVGAIRSGLESDVTEARGFRAMASSNSGGTVYLVAAKVSRPGVDDVGVWTTPDMHDPGPVYSAELIAETASVYPLPPGGSLYDVENFDEVRQCAEAAAARS